MILAYLYGEYGFTETLHARLSFVRDRVIVDLSIPGANYAGAVGEAKYATQRETSATREHAEGEQSDARGERLQRRRSG